LPDFFAFLVAFLAIFSPCKNLPLGQLFYLIRKVIAKVQWITPEKAELASHPEFRSGAAQMAAKKTAAGKATGTSSFPKRNSHAGASINKALDVREVDEWNVLGESDISIRAWPCSDSSACISCSS